MANDLPMESTEKEEPFAKRKRSAKSHSEEAVDIFWNMPVIEKMETVSELAGLNAKKETCYSETDLETGHDVKFSIVKVKLETDKEDLESSNALEATKNLLIDGGSCAISDDFLITTNDDSTEINNDDDDDYDEREETAISTDNAIDKEQCSSNCVVNEGLKSPMVTFDDISNVDNGNGICHGEMDNANSGKTIQDNDTVSEPHDECEDLRSESLTDDLKFFDSVQHGDVTKLVVIQQQEEEENAVELSDNTELEAIHHSGDEEESHSLNKNSCDLENVKVNNETLDSFTVELDAGEHNKISNQGPSDWHSSSEHRQNIIEDYATTPVVVSTEDPIDAGDNVQNNQQNIEYQSSIGDGDVDHRLSSMVGKEHDHEGSGEKEDPDTPCTIGSCVHKDEPAEHDICTDENFETGQKFGRNSTDSVSDVSQPVGRFHGKEATEIGEDRVTSLCPVNPEGQFDAGNDDKDMESSLDCVNNKTISLPAMDLENQDVIVIDEDKDIEARLDSQLSEAACNEDNTKILEFNGSGTLDKGASKEIPILDDTAAKETHHSETKVGRNIN